MARDGYYAGWSYILGILFSFLSISFFYFTSLILLNNPENFFAILCFGTGFLFFITLSCRFVLGALGLNKFNDQLGEDCTGNIKRS